MRVTHSLRIAMVGEKTPLLCSTARRRAHVKGCGRLGGGATSSRTHLRVLFDAARRHRKEGLRLRCCGSQKRMRFALLWSPKAAGHFQLGSARAQVCGQLVPWRVSVWMSGSKATTFWSGTGACLVCNMPLARRTCLDAGTALRVADVVLGRLERHNRRPALGTFPQRVAGTREAAHSSPSHRC